MSYSIEEWNPMMLYDHERTEKIVERLRNAEWIVRAVNTVASIGSSRL
jgi:hypothetical protein